MASIPLPALHINPPADPSEGMQRILAIKNMMDQSAQQRALMPGQLQQQRQTLEAGQQENAMRAQQMKNIQAQTAAMQEWNGKDLNDLPGLMLKHGATADVVMSTRQGLVKYQQELAAKDKAQLENEAKSNDLLLGHIDAIKGATDPQQRQQVAQSQAAQILSAGLHKHLDPQSQQMIQAIAQGQMVPNDDQLTLFEKGLTGHTAQIEQVLKTAETNKNTAQAGEATANTQKINQELQYGPSGVVADSKYRFLQQRLAQKLPIQAEDQAFIQAYEKQKKLVPMATAQVRVEGMQQSREYPVINKETGELEMRNAADINAGKGKYAPAGEGAKAMNKTALIEDIRGNISSVRELLSNPKLPEFSADQRGEIAIALGKQDSQTALTAMFRGGVLGSLTEEQQDYLIRMAQLKENAMAMRSVLGAGQGSEDLRAAIIATIPGPRTPSKQYALKQLEQFENVLNRLERGIPNVPLRPLKPQPQAPGVIYARDPQGKLHYAPAGSKLEPGWTLEEKKK